MKPVVILLALCFCTIATRANGPYRNYLLSTVYTYNRSAENHIIEQPTSSISLARIPRFERPKGAVFCRMEDMVTKATKVWLKIGVE